MDTPKTGRTNSLLIGAVTVIVIFQAIVLFEVAWFVAIVWLIRQL